MNRTLFQVAETKQYMHRGNAQGCGEQEQQVEGKNMLNILTAPKKCNIPLFKLEKYPVFFSPSS